MRVEALESMRDTADLLLKSIFKRVQVSAHVLKRKMSTSSAAAYYLPFLGDKAKLGAKEDLILSKNLMSVTEK